MRESGSRQRMIDSTIELMRRSGLSGAGINEIVRESAAPKGSVYHFFPEGKQQIVAEALEDYSPRVMRFMEEALLRGRSAPSKVRRLLDAFAQRVEEGDFARSCALGTVCLDLDRDLEALRVIVESTFDRWAELIARHFDLGDARRTRSFAELVLTVIEGAYIRARAQRSARPFRDAGSWLAELVQPAPMRRRRSGR
jgi:TetR/AcrR family transcriptional repressor of lmrAB and yxaGH operons